MSAMQKAVAKKFDVTPAMALKLIGMGIEFQFQQEIRPEVNVLTKRRQGGFKDFDFAKSESIQAEIAKKWITARIFTDLQSTWTNLHAEAEKCTEPAYVGKFGSVVFPGRIFSSK